MDHVEHQERRDPDQDREREKRNHGEQLAPAEIFHPKPIFGRLAQERNLYGPQVQTRRHRDPEHHDGRHRVDAQGTEEDLELRREVGQTGQPQGGEGGQDEGPAEQGHDPQEPAEILHLARVGPLLEHPDEQEEGAGDYAVAHHLQGRPVEGQRSRSLVGGRRGNRDAKDDVAHVVDAGVGDEALEVRLRERHERTVERGEYGEDRDGRGQLPEGLWGHLEGEAYQAVGAELE